MRLLSLQTIAEGEQLPHSIVCICKRACADSPAYILSLFLPAWSSKPWRDEERGSYSLREDRRWLRVAVRYRRVVSFAVWWQTA